MTTKTNRPDPCDEWGCEEFHSPYCPIGTEERREANRQAAETQEAWTRGISVTELRRQRNAGFAR